MTSDRFAKDSELDNFSRDPRHSLPKRRRYFDLYTINEDTGQQVWMGEGWQYDEGNCQVELTGYGTEEFNYQGPWQFGSLSEVLRIKGVKTFEWRQVL